jgi:hypothetical protein
MVMELILIKESLGGVTHVGVSREGFTWCSKMVESRGGVTWWSQGVVSHMFGCHVKDSHGGITHVGVPREGFTWWSHVVVSRVGGVT